MLVQSEIRVAIQHNNGLFLKPPTFYGKQYRPNFDVVNEFCISQGSVVIFSGVADKCIIAFVKFPFTKIVKLIKFGSFLTELFKK